LAKRHTEEEHENEERWLLTYSDLITLLMVFFVVMYSMSKVDAQKFKNVSQQLGAAFHSASTSPIPLDFGGGRRGDELTNQKGNPVVDPNAPRQATRVVKHLKAQFDHLREAGALYKSISVSTSATGTRLYVRLSDSLLFEPGSATLTPQADGVLEKMAAILNEARTPICVEGHTDNKPVHNDKFNSNWALSTARATSVLSLLVEKFRLRPEYLSASGYAEYRPLVPNDSEESMAKNRRVEFVIIDENESRTPTY
jgi:chemotaxis protein MotB